MYKSVLTKVINYGNRLSPTCFITYQRRHVEGENKTQKPIAKKMEVIKKYWFSRYLHYLKNYDETLEKTFPKMMHIYRIISIGTKDFYIDVKKYMLLRKKEKLHGTDSLSQNELQLSYTLPRDILKISPILLILAIPFTNYFMFPLAYFFPRKILTSHYWTPEQKDEFMLLDHKQRLKHNIQLFQRLKFESKNIKDLQLQSAWNNLICRLEDGQHLLSSEVLTFKELFLGFPFSLKSLKRNHVVLRNILLVGKDCVKLDFKFKNIKELLLIHGISSWKLNRKETLMDRGILIKKMDIAIMKDGGVSKMPINDLKWALSFRGINPLHKSPENMQTWLDKWLQVSTVVDKDNISLLLHCPILLAYNLNLK